MKRLYKLLLIFIMVLVPFVFINTTVKADLGPKPYVEIEIEGNSKGSYLTLLSKDSRYGPYSSEYGNEYNDKEIDLKFSEYIDKDGFYYLHEYSDISDGKYRWGYYPPLTFKILIYDSNNDKFITDDKIYERTSFETILKLTLSEDEFNVKTIDVEESNKYIGKVILGFVTRLCICILIEVLIALIFRLKKKQLLVVALANLFTQIILNLVLAIIIYGIGYQILIIVPVYIALEILILFIEWIIYIIFINRVNKDNIKSVGILLLYSFVSNVASLVLGFGILHLLGF